MSNIAQVLFRFARTRFGDSIIRWSFAHATQLSTEDADVLRDVFLTIQKVVLDLDLESNGFSVVVNGGPRQDVEQIHFHVLAGVTIRKKIDSAGRRPFQPSSR